MFTTNNLLSCPGPELCTKHLPLAKNLNATLDVGRFIKNLVNQVLI